MPTQFTDRIALRLFYENAAREYSKSHPIEHLLQSRQRAITLASLALVEAVRPDFHVFNELLIRYPNSKNGGHSVEQVVPDNFVVIHNGPLEPGDSFNTASQASKPFWALDTVVEDNFRKDYVDNMTRYGRDLQVPYYMLFEPQKLRLTLYKLGTTTLKFKQVRPNAAGRFAIPELDIEMGLVDVWVRFWFRGKLLPLPGEMAAELDESKNDTRKARHDTRVAEEAARVAEETARVAEEAAQREREAREVAESEVAKLRAELAAIRKSS